MNDRQRERLLDRTRRQSATIGAEMPDEVEVDGRTVDLTEFVFECERLDAIPESERERIEDVKRTLRRERLRRKQRIEEEDISEATGERLVEEIHGIDRAINALEGLDTPDIAEQLRQKQLEDARELLALVDRRV